MVELPWTTKQAAERLSVPERTLQRWKKEYKPLLMSVQVAGPSGEGPGRPGLEWSERALLVAAVIKHLRSVVSHDMIKLAAQLVADEGFSVGRLLAVRAGQLVWLGSRSRYEKLRKERIIDENEMLPIWDPEKIRQELFHSK